MAQGQTAEHRLHIRYEPGGEEQAFVVLSWYPKEDTPQVVQQEIKRFIWEKDEQERLKWYLESYRECSFVQAETLVKEAEALMMDLGERLFNVLFTTPEAMTLWNRLSPLWSEIRVNLLMVGESVIYPWEILYHRETGRFLALEAYAFLRVPEPKPSESLPPSFEPPLRILVVISWPEGIVGIRFRSIARRLVAALAGHELFYFEVLRPPTFSALLTHLKNAKESGHPYHVLHFDGHGIWLNLAKMYTEDPAFASSLSPEKQTILEKEKRDPSRGYLIFADGMVEDSEHLGTIHGVTLGDILVHAGIQVVVLNACLAPYPGPSEEEDLTIPTGREGDRYERVRAFMTVASEIAHAGVPAILVIPYNLHVVMAAQLVADLYIGLLEGQSFGNIVNQSRKMLSYTAKRHFPGYPPRSCQDWFGIQAFESEPLSLFPVSDTRLKVMITELITTPDRSGQINLPMAPFEGLFSRDEAILAIDRVFDDHAVALLHGPDGMGKTTTAAEFARWYDLTGGLLGPVIYSSLAKPISLGNILDNVLGHFFDPLLIRQGIVWHHKNCQERQDLLIRLLNQLTPLWIWDDIELSSTSSMPETLGWNQEEQADFRHFIERLARESKTKLLLISRERKGWHEAFSISVALEPLGISERRALALRWMKRHPPTSTLSPDLPTAWSSLLRFSGGNPCTLTLLVNLALVETIETRQSCDAFIARMIHQEQVTGSDAPTALTSIVHYLFAQYFTEQDRKILSLLYLFRGHVGLSALVVMGYPHASWHLEGIAHVTREEYQRVLGLAVKLGLFNDRSGGSYTPQSSLQRYFKAIFDHYYASPAAQAQTIRAYAETFGWLGNLYQGYYLEGKHDILHTLQWEWDNLLSAQRIAKIVGYRKALVRILGGLQILYTASRQQAVWGQLVEEVLPQFIDLDSSLPLPGREGEWDTMTEYRISIAISDRQWDKAESLQIMRVARQRERAKPLLEYGIVKLDEESRGVLKQLATSLHKLGEIQREQEKSGCEDCYVEAMKIFQRLGDRSWEAKVAFSLGHAYIQIAALHNLNHATRWYQYSKELHPKEDRVGHGQCAGQLGLIAYERFRQAQQAHVSLERLQQYLNTALRYYRQALELLPPNSVDNLAVVHTQLGNIYGDAGELENSIRHYQLAIRYLETYNHLLDAAQIRHTLAVMLSRVKRFSEALEQAESAIANIQQTGMVPEWAQDINRLIQEIRQSLLPTRYTVISDAENNPPEP